MADEKQREDEKENPVQGIPRPDWTENLKANLTARFFGTADRTEAFCRLLQQHHALIAGGFLLKAIHPNVDVQNEGWKQGDIDLYVNLKNTRPLMEDLFQSTGGLPPLFKALAYKGYLASLYCRSFMRRNGIRGVKTIAVKTSQQPPYFTLDLVSIRNRRTPVEVVTNFDLTFCQLWFDGENVYATHPEHIEQRRGQLQGDYVETYLAGNRFLKKRIEKYRKRGFEITFDHEPSDATVLHYLMEFPQPCHKEDRPYEDLVKHAIHRTLCLRYSQRKSDAELFPYVSAIPAGNAIGSHRNEAMHRTTMEYTPSPRVFRQGYKDAFLPHEGYDSTEEEDMKALRTDPANEWTEENFQRDLTNLFVNTFSPIDFVWEDKSTDPYYFPRTNLRDSPSMPFKKYMMWRSGMLSLLPRGEDMFGAKGPLLFFHQHDAEGGITPKSLRMYVKTHYEANQNAEPLPIPCFYQEKCEEMLTTAEQHCVMRHPEETDEEQEWNENGVEQGQEQGNQEQNQEEQEEQEEQEQNQEEKEEQEEEEQGNQEEQEQRGGRHRALRYTRSKKHPHRSRTLAHKKTKS